MPLCHEGLFHKQAAHKLVHIIMWEDLSNELLIGCQHTIKIGQPVMKLYVARVVS